MDLLGISNGSASFAARQLSLSQTIIQRSLERISSGLRINRASDDPAGLALSETLRSQVRGLNRASMNALDEVGMLQVADSGMGEINASIQNIGAVSAYATPTSTSDECFDRFVCCVNGRCDNNLVDEAEAINPLEHAEQQRLAGDCHE